jgi:RNA polymerase sigma factor (TIGR02999 family)
MPRPGGESDKLGNRFESAWTVDSMLDLLLGKITAMTVEPFTDGEGVEFQVQMAGGLAAFHSVKRQRSASDWTLYALTKQAQSRRSLLGDLFEKMKKSSHFHSVFVSSTGANALRELTERASRSADLRTFYLHLQFSGRLLAEFESYIKPLADGDEEWAYQMLRRLRIVLINENELERRIEEKIQSSLTSQSGQNLDSHSLRLKLADIAVLSMGNTLTADSVLSALDEKGTYIRLRKRELGATRTLEVDRSVVVGVNRGPSLVVPQANDIGAGLRNRYLYSARSTPFVGRDKEMEDLVEFCRAEGPLLWWLWLGLGGVGKSRIALELCFLVSNEWDAGFLVLRPDAIDWKTWRPERPTLVVIDYLASRAREAGDLIDSACSARYAHPVRILFLERTTTGTWWDDFLHSESSSTRERILSKRYLQDHELGSLDDSALWSIANARGPQSEALHARSKEFLGYIREIDPHGRPLFASMAAEVWASGEGLKDWTLEELISVVLLREESRWRAQLLHEGYRNREIDGFRNAIALVTAVGGIRTDAVESFAAVERHQELVSHVGLTFEIYCLLVGSRSSGTGLDPLEPDVLGEAYFLGRLDALARSAADQKLLASAWQYDPPSVAHFLGRVCRDFPTHSAVARAVHYVGESERERLWWSTLVVDACVSLIGPRPQVSNRLVARLAELASKHSAERLLGQHLAIARFQRAVQLAHSSQLERAENDLTEVVQDNGAARSLRSLATYNRGAVRQSRGDVHGAWQDYQFIQADAGVPRYVRVSAIFNCIAIAFQTRDQKAALEHIDKLIELEGLDPTMSVELFDYRAIAASGFPDGEAEPRPHGILTAFSSAPLYARKTKSAGDVEWWYEEIKRIGQRILVTSSDWEVEDLVHNAYIRLWQNADRLEPMDTAHLRAVISITMRHIVIDHARASRRSNRGGGWMRMTIPDEILDETWDPVLILRALDLDVALRELRQVDSAGADLIDLRFFGGLGPLEISEVMGMSRRTIEHQLRSALIWLRSRVK